MELKFWLRRKPDGIVKDNSPRQIYINLNPSSSISSSRKLSSPHAPEPIVEPASHDRTSTTSSAFTGHHHQLQKTDSTSLLLLNSSSQANLLSNSSSNNPDTSSSNLNGQRRPSSVDNINNNRRFSTTPNPHREFTKNYNTNEVSTSKYTIWTFLPKNLYEQFRSVANFYFLFIAILQAFPTFEEVSFGLVIVPIVIILGFTGVKDAVEDWSRHAADRRVNDAVCYLLSCKIKSMRSSNSNNGILVILIDFVSSFSSSLLHFFKSILSIVKGGQPKPRATRRYDPDHLEPSHYLDFSEIASLPNERLEMKDKEKWSPSWCKSQWKNVKMGDVILIRNNESIPADMVIVSTSEQNVNCFVETKNLDGETNLKVKRGLEEYSYMRTSVDCANMKCLIEMEAPTVHMYTFNGVATVFKNDSNSDVLEADQKVVPLNINSVLLRGCVLRNTDWVIGIVVATGVDTKLMLNSGKTPSKRSRIARQMNPQIILNFMILFIMSLICAVLGELYTAAFNHVSPPFYYWVAPKPLYTLPGSNTTTTTSSNSGGGGYNPSYEALFIFFNCLIIFQNIVPIAIPISIDIIKIFMSYLIHVDEEMIDPETETYASPRAWNLCDDLGQIEYIFSDKTGTLTCNVMEFRKCSINGIAYGLYNSSPSAQESQEILEVGHHGGGDVCGGEADVQAKAEARMREIMAKNFDVKYVNKDKLSFIDPEMHEQIAEGLSGSGHNVSLEQATAIIEFFSLLAVCHTVLVDTPDAASPTSLNYKAQSPDEAALVAAARDNGFTFLKREDDRVFLDIMGTEKVFTILHVIEFSSDRKRMSVLVKKEGSPEIILLCKGADSVVYERLRKDTNETLLRLNTRHLEMFANDGLRTLCLAFRIVPQAEYDEWVIEYENAHASLENREANIDRVSSSIETELNLMGATAIEDKLQDGVPECIATLSKAGIKLWVLTGDKLETAINIGFSCNLLTRSMILIVIKSTETKEITLKQIQDALGMFWDPLGKPKRDNSFALIIDGESLKFALEKPCKDLLLELACRCNAVLCCRVSPLQKAQVVKLVRFGLSAMCLAIGDGANDVSMIQAADIGVGISGKEGLQAVMASDYSIGQFRFLSKLLLVHGRWAYMRTSELIFGYFYKNSVWLFVLFWYQFDIGFSGDVLMDFTYGMFFNTVFSLLPNFCLGLFDQDVNDKISMQTPQLYQRGIRQLLYNTERFWFYVFDGIYQSVVCYYVAVLVVGESIVDQRGFAVNKDAIGTTAAFYIVFTVNLYMAQNNFSWIWITHMSLWLTLVVWIGYVFLHAAPVDSPTFGVAVLLFQQPSFYLGLILAISVCMFPHILFKFSQQAYFPNDIDIVQEFQKYLYKDGDVVNLEIKSTTTTPLAPAPPPLSQPLQDVKIKGKRRASELDEGMRRAHSEPTVNIIPVDASTTSSRISETGPAGGGGGSSSSSDGGSNTSSLKLALPSSAKSSMRRIKSESILGSILSRLTSPISPSSSSSKQQREPSIVTTIPASDPMNPANIVFTSSPYANPNIDIVDNNESSTTTGRGGTDGARPSKSRQRSNRSTSSQMASIQDILQPLSSVSRRTGEFMRSLPRRLRMSSMASSSSRSADPSRRLVFMGDHAQTVNTGYAFSGGSGMEEIVTPTRATSRKSSVPPPAKEQKKRLVGFVPTTDESVASSSDHQNTSPPPPPSNLVVY